MNSQFWKRDLSFSLVGWTYLQSQLNKKVQITKPSFLFLLSNGLGLKIKICQVMVSNQGNKQSERQQAIQQQSGGTAARSVKSSCPSPRNSHWASAGLSCLCPSGTPGKKCKSAKHILFLPPKHKWVSLLQTYLLSIFLDWSFLCFNRFNLIPLSLPLAQKASVSSKALKFQSLVQVKWDPSLCSPGIKSQFHWCQDFEMQDLPCG